MPNVIQLNTGKIETVFDLEGMLYLVEQHMGSDARFLLEEFTTPEEDDTDYIADLEAEYKRYRDHHHEVMKELRELSETEARLIREKDIDRKALSDVAGKIGKITWREINVR